MNGEESPRPWQFEFRPPRMEKPHSDHEKAHFVDANGRDVWLSRKNAALIVAAVNGRAAIAAVLRDMEEDLEAAWEGTPLRRALAKYVARLCEIAGEGETPTGKGVGE